MTFRKGLAKIFILGLIIQIFALTQANNSRLTYSKNLVSKTILEFFISSAMAYDYETDANGHQSILNCRSTIPSNPNNPNNPGYFKAYFEDLADNNGNGSNTGYDHPSLGSARRQAVCQVLEEIANIVMMNEPGGATPEILFHKNMPPNSSPNALASASPYIFSQSSSSAHSGFLHQHIITRNDPAAGPDAAINTNWNSAVSWSVDSSLNANTFDFKTVIRHEILHAMGFMSRLPKEFNITNTAVPHSHWDKFLYSPTTSFLTPQLSPLLQAPVGAPSLWFINNSSIYQGRKNYVGAPLDGVRPLYTPPSFEPGSSLSHFDMNRPEANSQSYIMHPSIAKGVQQNIHPHEKEVLCHLGYRVRNMQGCTNFNPFALDDVGTLVNADSQHIAFLVNDFSSDGTKNSTNLRLNSIEFQSPMSVIYFTNFTQTNPGSPAGQEQYACSGSETNLMNGDVKCMKIFTNLFINQIKATYTIKDISTNKISAPASILFSRCGASNPDEHLCNGDFEMEPLSTLSYAISMAPFWKEILQTGDLISLHPANSSITTDRTKLPYIGGISLTEISHFPNSQGTHGGFLASSPTPLCPSGYVVEAISTELRNSLEPGICYKLSLDAISLNEYNMPANMGGLIVKLSKLNPETYSDCANDILDSATVLNHFSIPISGPGAASWTNKILYFTPSQNYQFLSLEAAKVPFDQYLYLDNVSLKKVSDSFCSANQNNEISGVVYYDNLQTDGEITLGEQVLAEVTVRLYDSQNLIKGETTTDASGTYRFTGISTDQAYKIVLTSENLYQSITEPLANNSLDGFQHTRIVSFNNGGMVSGENFGVIFQSQTPPTISASITNCTTAQLNSTVPPGINGVVTYSWSGPNGFSSNQQNISVNTQGVYTLTVSNANDYASSTSYNLQFPSLNLTAYANPAMAPNYNNGSIISQVSNGTPPYTFYGNAVSASGQVGPSANTSVTRNGLPGSSTTTYSVYAKDSQGCQSNTVSNIKVLKKLTVDTKLLRYCMPNPDGSMIVAQSSGGHGSISYSWLFNNAPISNNTSMILSVSNGVAPAYAPGNYKVTVTDSLGQTASATKTMTSTPPPPLLSTITHATGNLNNGSIYIQADGWGSTNTNPVTYTYSWSDGIVVNTTNNSHTRSNLAPGTYTLTLTGSNNFCSATTTSFNIGKVVNGKVEFKQEVKQ